MSTIEVKPPRESAILVGVQLARVSDEEFTETMSELRELTFSSEAEIVGEITQRRLRPDSRYYIGTGKQQELLELAKAQKSNLVVFDEQLSPAQIRNLENKLEVKVIDRNTLILDIFARRARSKEAKLQVELAQLQYLLPRLTRMWSHFSKQQGGVGTRGPGETQLETDRREIGARIKSLKKRLEKVKQQRQTQRKGRRSVFKIALVGYTNAGKSTLFNRLTSARVRADDKLFCTLDAVTRLLHTTKRQQVVISDTVGFIKKLPHELVASFASTLDEVRFADLLLHVVDISHRNCIDHFNKTIGVLEEIGAGEINRLLLVNKMDLLSEDSIPVLAPEISAANVFHISAKTGQGMDDLLKYLSKYVEDRIRCNST